MRDLNGLIGLLCLGAMAACSGSETGLTDIKDGELGDTGLGAPDILVEPVSVDFGPLAVGAELSEVLAIRNLGDEPLQIFGVSLDAEGPYTLGQVSSVAVPPGGQADLVVTFAPETAGQRDVQVLVDSNDPDEPTAAADITGLGMAPVIDLQPVDYDFGSLLVGCEASQPITIGNLGNQTLEVSELSVNSGSIDLSFDADEATNGPLPWAIEPGELRTVWVDYQPFDPYQDLQYLFVASNDPQLPEAMALQSGVASFAGRNTDQWEQPIEQAVDILFAVDKSGSMGGDLANVEANFQTFISTLAGLDADYQVAVVTADNGCFAGPDNFLDSSMSEAEQQAIFSTMLAGPSGGNTEREYMLMEAALSPANVGSSGCNAGFLREHASLALVGVTDEPEQSVSPYTAYVSLFQGLKENPDDVVIHAIAGDYPNGCGSAQPGTGLYEGTVATGGLFLSICAADFGVHLQALAEGSAANLTSFELTGVPVVETLEVRVDGGLVPSNGGAVWSYDFAENSVDFVEDRVPQGGSSVQADYALQGECEG